METFSVHGAPSEYILQEGSLDSLESRLQERGFQKVLIVHGEKSWAAAKPFFPSFHSVVIEEYTYSGECSLEEIEELAELVKGKSFDALIGVGGGKVLDLVKAASHFTGKPHVLIPTLASNCSPWTPLSVIYDEAGAFIRYDVFPVSASLVLIEPRILLTAPQSMLIAGIGDTLAKWYEADVQMAVIENKPVALMLSHYTARQCKDLLLQHSEGAISAAKSGSLNDDFIKVAETIIMLGGMVGGFGDHYGRIAGAHSIHNGLTILEETHHALHGEKVAYGILVQLVLEDKWKEIEQLIPFYQQLGLPQSLAGLGVTQINEEVFAQIAVKSTVPEESIHVMPIGDIISDQVSTAIAALERKYGNFK
ncbi:iron-containing alcohol dehydrogenase family protein [Neobacillus mesonae]|uniref:iron-containing alcohol dehydrogenase family protein n=1 Tax=Neobacillus mesonae TaxID=1193713 RepID=UPI00203D0516|nr:iron-containing alcohol dehydrogenase family protein [Neobacillus mesonae]MCM3568561.1 iron-containing alcohol dehydrogenase family protein [Neobacillus mesonae]